MDGCSWQYVCSWSHDTNGRLNGAGYIWPLFSKSWMDTVASMFKYSAQSALELSA
jgi:hypothetical protein